MTARKRTASPKPRLLVDAIAAGIRQRREASGWTQDRFAEEMRSFGFKWSRSTVAEVEGSGRKRQLSAVELLGVAIALSTPIEELIWPSEEARPLKLTDSPEQQALPDRTYLTPFLVSASTVMDPAGAASQMLHRVIGGYQEHVSKMAAEIRSTADYLESETPVRLKQMLGLPPD